MKRLLALVLLLAIFATVQPAPRVRADNGYMIYFIPIQQIGNARGPQYFQWRFSATGIVCKWSLMDYGFINVGLLVTPDITPADDTALRTHADVYAFPNNLDVAITDKAALTAILEPANIPTDWLTASTTYRQLLRYMAGMFQFNQRFSGIAANADGLPHSIFDNGVTLDSNYNSLDANHKAWFVATLQSFGYNNGVQGNPKLRSLAKQAGDLWGAAPFIMGGFTF